MVTTSISKTAQIKLAKDILYLTRKEARQLGIAEINRLITVLEQLSGDDWVQPTDCTEWCIREMVAHLAGACAAYTSWGDFKRQLVANPYAKEMDALVDAINRVQLEDRTDASNEELVAEFKEVAPKAVENRQKIPGLLRALPVIPFAEPMGKRSLGYLVDNIYLRDWMMHRIDICRATNKPLKLTADHDGRIVELVLFDLVQNLRSYSKQHPAIELHITGAVTMVYQFGEGSEPEATVALDFVQFNRLASGRIKYDQAGAQTSGNPEAAQWFLEHCWVEY